MSQPRSRPRFDGLAITSAPGGRCQIGVKLEWYGEVIERSVTGIATQQGRLRAASQAALDSALEVVRHRAQLSLVGVKAVRAFDGWVAIVRVNGEVSGRAYRLLGSAACEEEEDLARAAAIAVLNATNRVLEQLADAPAAPFDRTPGEGSAVPGDGNPPGRP